MLCLREQMVVVSKSEFAWRVEKFSGTQIAFVAERKTAQVRVKSKCRGKNGGKRQYWRVYKNILKIQKKSNKYVVYTRIAIVSHIPTLKKKVVTRRNIPISTHFPTELSFFLSFFLSSPLLTHSTPSLSSFACFP